MRISRCTTYVLLSQAYCGLQLCRYLRTIIVYNIYNRKKLQFITLLTAMCIVSHIENSKNDKGYITWSTFSECQRAA